MLLLIQTQWRYAECVLLSTVYPPEHRLRPSHQHAPYLAVAKPFPIQSGCMVSWTLVHLPRSAQDCGLAKI